MRNARFNLATVCALVAGSIAPVALAETICVKYGPCPLDLSSFECTQTPQSSFVRRVCHDAAKSFMAINLRDTWYPYCAIKEDVVSDLLSAGSVGRYYNQNIRSQRDGTRGPYDCRDHSMPQWANP